MGCVYIYGGVYFVPFPTKYSGGGTTETFNQENQMATSIFYLSQQNTRGAAPRKHLTRKIKWRRLFCTLPNKIQWGRHHGNIQPGKSNGDVYFLPFPTKYNGGGTTETFNQEDQMAPSILYPSQQNTVGASPRKHFHLPHSHPPISHPRFPVR